ncbi:MAG: T9SS type A sorting domain-containing protein [Fibromonadaceae bacterium]|jgi:hypothetical protein|nr:T9SS type A sorting domain-containing protein [Fibromonadaceae bacterium]
MKKSTKILQVLFFLFIGSVGVQTAFAQTVWNGTANTVWYTNNPLASEFTITTAQQFAGFKQLVNDGNDFAGKIVKLGANIMLNDTINWKSWATTPPANKWSPIEGSYGTTTTICDILPEHPLCDGYSSSKEGLGFQGTFDGNDFVVSGVYIGGDNYDGTGSLGLFGYLGSNGTIKNLGIIASYIEVFANGGMLVADNYGTIIDCYSNGEVAGVQELGGLIGSNYGIVRGSHSAGTITVQGTPARNIGGLVGYNEGEINDSYSVSMVMGSIVEAGAAGGSLNVGGLVGFNTSTSAIKDTYSTSIVKGHHSVGGLVGLNEGEISNSYSTGVVIGTERIGGLVGWNRGDGNISGSNSAGEVFGNVLVGGLVGWNTHSDISNSNSISDVTGNRMVGGLIGYNNGGTTSTCHFTGKVVGESAVGGLIGANLGGTIDDLVFGTIRDSYSEGDVTGSIMIGGLVGINTGATISNSHSTSAVAGDTLVGGLVGINQFLDEEEDGIQLTSIGTISHSYFSGTITGNYRIGGLTGANAGIIRSSYSDGAITGKSFVGGLAGLNVGGMVNDYYYGEINSSYSVSKVVGDSIVGGLIGTNAGTIKDSYSEGVISGKIGVGGFVGFNLDTIINCYYTGTVTGNNNIVAGTAGLWVGGIAGLNQGMISGCYSEGMVTGENQLGGLVGNNAGTINNSYSASVVMGNGIVAPYIGGLAGINGKGEIFNSYSIGEVKNSTSIWSYSGGLVGSNSDIPVPFEEFGQIAGFLIVFSKTFDLEAAKKGAMAGKQIGKAVEWLVTNPGTITNSYYDSLTSKQSSCVGGKEGIWGRNTAQMKQQSNFVGWNFNTIWDIESSINNGYPYLLNLPKPSIKVPSYHIFAYNGKDAENVPTAYGGNVGVYVYNDATASNPKYEDSDGFLGFSEGVAKLWNITLATPDKYSGAGIYIGNKTAGNPNIADCKEISYYYKGDPHWFLVEFQKDICVNPTLADDNKWGLPITPAQSTWVKRTVDLTTLNLARSWPGAGCGGATGDINAVPVDLTKVTNMSWAFDDNVNNGASKNLMIANVACLTPSGGAIADNAPPEDIIVTSGWSSLSSSSSTDTPSSSSGITPSSSSSDGSTPIRFPQIATSNQATQIHNGINLQVTSNAVVEIFNLKGDLIWQQNFSGGVYTVSLGHLPKGVYIVKTSFGSEKKILQVPVR